MRCEFRYFAREPVQCSKDMEFVHICHWDNGRPTVSFRCEEHRNKSTYMHYLDSRLETLTLEEYQLYKIKEAL